MFNYKSSQCIISINIFTEYLFSRKDLYQSNQCCNKWDFPIKLGVCFTSFSFGLMLDKISKAEEFRSKQRKIMVLSNQSLRRKCFFLCYGACSETITECEFVRCLFALDEVQWGQVAPGRTRLATSQKVCTSSLGWLWNQILGWPNLSKRIHLSGGKTILILTNQDVWPVLSNQWDLRSISS